MNAPQTLTKDQAKLIRELCLDPKTVTFKKQGAALPCQITIHTGDKGQTHLVSRDTASGKLKLEVTYSLYPTFHLSNHSWQIAPNVTTEMRNDPTRILRDLGETVLVRDSPLFAETNGEPAQRTQEPNLKSSSLEICGEAEYLVELLKFKAMSGDSMCAQELAHIAIEAVMTLAKIADKNPPLLLPYSQRCNGWPVIKMKRQNLTGEEKTLFAKLKIGSQSLIELDAATARWKWDDAGKIANELLSFIQQSRTDPIYGFADVSSKAKNLKNFNDDSAPDWWLLAKDTLLKSYPNLENVDEFNRLVTSQSKRRSPGRIRAAILDVLKARFLSFAKNTA